jgi:hypothetical protein
MTILDYWVEVILRPSRPWHLWNQLSDSIIAKKRVKIPVRSSQIDQSASYCDKRDFLWIKVFLNLNSPKLIKAFFLPNMNEHVLTYFLHFTSFCGNISNLDNYVLKKIDINCAPPKAATLARYAVINSPPVSGIFVWISVNPRLLIHLSHFWTLGKP